MSKVSNQIINVDVLEPSNWLETVNEALSELSGQTFVLVDADEEHSGWYGGGKCWEAETAMAAMNHWSGAHTIEVLRELEWMYPENVQLIYQDQDDERMTLWNLVEVSAS